MRRARSLPRGQDAAYHCISRTVAGQHLFKEQEREVFCGRLRRHAKFCQIRVNTHTCLSNHFHLIATVPGKIVMTDEKLFKAIRIFYGADHSNTLEFAKAMKKSEGGLLERLREQYLARMGNLSVFMKELKESFSKWFNSVHDRFGTLWAERFTSVNLPCGFATLVIVAAYIDLNSLRAGMVSDPGHYRHCGYTEAVARDGPAREGLASVLPGESWEEKLAHYRMLLFGKGAKARNSNQAVIDPRKVLEVYRNGGELSLSEALLLKVRYFSEGIALGTEEFVNEIFQEFHQKYCKVRKQGGWPMKGADWGGLRSLKKIKEPMDLPASQEP